MQVLAVRWVPSGVHRTTGARQPADVENQSRREDRVQRGFCVLVLRRASA